MLSGNSTSLLRQWSNSLRLEEVKITYLSRKPDENILQRSDLVGVNHFMVKQPFKRCNDGSGACWLVSRKGLLQRLSNSEQVLLTSLVDIDFHTSRDHRE